MEWLRNILWRRVEARVDAAITIRLLEFEEALVERGQIERSYPPEPPRIREALSTADYMSGPIV